MQTIYFDEAGFTGDKLLDEDQPVKKYTLATHFFEYIFEPVLAAGSSIFYREDFHRFISTILYVGATAGDDCSKMLLEEFEALMRTKDPAHLDVMLAPLGTVPDLWPPVWQTMTFIACHRQVIEEEVARPGEVDVIGKWVLDLTTSVLFGLLSTWSERFDVMDVYCDASKPLAAQRVLFDVMVGRTDKHYYDLGRRAYALTFNLAQPIQLVDSKTYPGLQLADVLASTTAYALKTKAEDQSREWLEKIEGAVATTGIIPDSDVIDLDGEGAFVNWLILHALIERSLQQQDLLADMPRYIATAKQQMAARTPTPPGSSRVALISTG